MPRELFQGQPTRRAVQRRRDPPSEPKKKRRLSPVVLFGILVAGLGAWFTPNLTLEDTRIASLSVFSFGDGHDSGEARAPEVLRIKAELERQFQIQLERAKQELRQEFARQQRQEPEPLPPVSATGRPPVPERVRAKIERRKAIEAKRASDLRAYLRQKRAGKIKEHNPSRNR